MASRTRSPPPSTTRFRQVEEGRDAALHFGPLLPRDASSGDFWSEKKVSVVMCALTQGCTSRGFRLVVAPSSEANRASSARAADSRPSTNARQVGRRSSGRFAKARAGTGRSSGARAVRSGGWSRCALWSALDRLEEVSLSAGEGTDDVAAGAAGVAEVGGDEVPGPGVVEGNDRYCPKANRPFAVLEALSPASVRAISTYFSLSRVSSQSLTSFKAIRVVRAICESSTKLSISAEASRIACKTIRWAPISLAMTCLDSGRSSRRNCRASMLGQNPEWR